MAHYPDFLVLLAYKCLPVDRIRNFTWNIYRILWVKLFLYNFCHEIFQNQLQLCNMDVNNLHGYIHPSCLSSHVARRQHGVEKHRADRLWNERSWRLDQMSRARARFILDLLHRPDNRCLCTVSYSRATAENRVDLVSGQSSFNRDISGRFWEPAWSCARLLYSALDSDRASDCI